MSPIGRVFIVLNLALAGGFAFFSGTHLQRQHDYKTKWETAQTEAAEQKKTSDAEIERLRQERTTLEVAKTARENELNATKNSLAQAMDENKLLNQQLTDLKADLKSLAATAQAANTQSAAAWEKAQEAFEASIAANNQRDAAVRAKDTAEAENREMKTTIASLNATIEGKDNDLAKLEAERNELNVLVSLAERNGFIVGLAAPPLAGTVLHVANNRLCTIKITDNPGNVDIADQLSKRKFSFAIYDDANGYKGEATATDYHPEENAVTCTITLSKGTITTGDKASTKTQ